MGLDTVEFIGKDCNHIESCYHHSKPMSCDSKINTYASFDGFSIWPITSLKTVLTVIGSLKG